MKTYIKFLLSLFIKSFLKIFIIFFMLILIINIFEQIDFLKEVKSNLLFPIFLSLLNTPSIIFDILPFIFLVTAQVFFSYLIENNELRIFKYFGLNNIKIVKIISLFTFLLGLILVIFYYNFSSKLKNYYLEIKNSYSNDNKYLAVITENGLWIKDEINQKINIINASTVDNEFLINVLVTQFDDKYNYIQTIQSEKVDISSTTWKISKAIVSENNRTKNSTNIILKSNFDLKKINSLFSNLSSLTLMELYQLRKSYISLNYSLVDIDSHLHKLFSYPFYLTIMTILSSIIMFNVGFQKNLTFNITFGIFISVIIYYINVFFNVLGTSEKIPVVLSIWLPLIILSIICVTSIIRLNEK